MDSKWISVVASDIQGLRILSMDKKNFQDELDFIEVFEEMRTQPVFTICNKNK